MSAPQQERQFVVQQCYLEGDTPAKANERGAQIIKLATELMAAGKSKGWSHALELAAKEVK